MFKKKEKGEREKKKGSLKCRKYIYDNSDRRLESNIDKLFKKSKR